MTNLNTPLSESDRLRSLDIVRGVAVLGIFMMNIRNFGWPLRQFDNPSFPSPPATPADLWSWGLANLLFEDKMIAIFSILFGAGIVVMAGRAAKPALLHYRRMFILLTLGLIHAYGLWYGDVLNTYAFCGAAVFVFIKARPAVLIGAGCVVFVTAIALRVGPAMLEMFFPPEAPSPPSMGSQIFARAIETEAAAYQGSWMELARWRAHLNTVWHFIGGIEFSFWRSAGYMLIGMGLARLDVFSARRPAREYWGLMLGGYAIGFSLVIVGMWPTLARVFGHSLGLSGEAREVVSQSAWTCRYLGALFVALGHIGLVMLLCRVHFLRLILHPLACAGRMALSNYLLQTLIAISIFDGWAGGQWGKWRISELTLLVVSVWAAQLIISPTWLRFFRYGPVEWCWRSATYLRLQPLRR